MLSFEDWQFSPCMHTDKSQRERSSVYVHMHMCIYQKIFQRMKSCPYKFITAAKLTVSSVKNQLWGEKLHNTIKHLLQNTVSNVFDCDSPDCLVFHLLLYLLKLFRMCLLYSHRDQTCGLFLWDMIYYFVQSVFKSSKHIFQFWFFACDRDVLHFLWKKRCHEVSSADVSWAKGTYLEWLPMQSNRLHPPSPSCWMRYYLSMHLHLDWKTLNGCWVL